jgi:hypothetical protein
MISLLCHDIGYVRGVCRGDRNRHYVCNENGDLVPISAGATDGEHNESAIAPKLSVKADVADRQRRSGATLQPIVEHSRLSTPN